MSVVVVEEYRGSLDEGRMFELALLRPTNYFTLTHDDQWNIDDKFGILDWKGGCAHEKDVMKCDDCYKRFSTHFMK